MKVEIWSDVVCPFCYIGKRKFEAALAQFAHRDQVEVVYRSFELDPSAARVGEQPIYESLAAKYGIPVEQAKAMNENVARQARTVGLEFVFDAVTPANTYDAHRLIHYAATQGKRQDMVERLFRAYFTESKRVGDRGVLAELAADAGLDRQAAAQLLAGDEYGEDVRRDEQEARSLGINGVPFYLLNRKYAVSGAQSSELFLQALEKAWEEESKPSFVDMSSADSAVCTDDACAAPGDASDKPRA